MGGARHQQLGKTEGEFQHRKSPRTPVRKLKQKRMESQLPNKSEPRKTRKRKSVSYEDDPSYSESEDVDASNEQRKKVPGYRCSSHLIPELLEQFCPKQLEWVVKIGFGALKDMKGSRAPKSLTMWLVDQVDTTNGTINVCGKPVDIRKGVKRLLNLPSGDRKVPHPLNGRAKAKIPKAGTSRQDDKHSDKGRGQTAKEATKVVIAEKEDEVAFCQSFVMLVLCIYLAPTTSLNINRSYFPAVMDVTQISLLDWCGFIGDYLISGIEEFRRSKASHVQVPGCVHLLPLLYLDALIEQKALVLPEALKLPEGEPRIHFVTSEHLAFLASADIKSKTKDCIEYGLLQENIIGSKEGDGPSTIPGPCVAEVGKHTKCASSVGVETNASELLDSLFKEIKDGREKLVNEFHRQIVEAEEKTFGRFKQNFLKCLTVSERTTTISKPNDHHEFEPGSSETHQNCRESTKQDQHNNKGKENEEHQESEEEKEKYAEEPSRSKNGTERPSNKISRTNNETSGQHRASSPSKPDIANDVNKVMNENDSVLNDARGFETSVQRMDIDCPELAEQGTKDAPGRWIDELEEAASIGREAAMEAAINHADISAERTDGLMLSILSDAAESEGPPMFDNSPAVQADMSIERDTIVRSQQISGITTEPSGNYQLAGNLSTFHSPLFDKSPMTPSNLGAKETRNLTTLITIPENGAASTNGGTSSLPGCLLHAAAVAVGEDVKPLDEEAALIASISGTEQNEGEDEEDSSSNCEESMSGESEESESGDYEECTDIPSAEDDDGNNDDQHLHSSLGFPESPSYTLGTQDFIDIPDDPDSPSPLDIMHIPPLDKEIEFGFRFKFGCSVSSSTGKLYESFNQIGSNENRVEDVGKFKFVLCKHASETNKMHVSNSSARVSKRLIHVPNPAREGTKIQIKGFHITKGEFADSLKPNGEVCQNLMGLCSVAIMADWETNKRVILDQGTIRELMREGHVCKEMKVLAKLKKLRLEEVEELFLPMLTSNHWILVVVNVLNGIVSFYDSILVVDEGDHPHRKIWDIVAANLQHGYNTAMRKTVEISKFCCKYPRVKQQTTLHDCGFHVIQALECYKSEDIVGREQKKTMMPYRKYLSHVLVYHRFNDLNPLREGIQVEETRMFD